MVTHVGVALTFGMIVLAMIYGFGDVSGAQLESSRYLWFLARPPIARQAEVQKDSKPGQSSTSDAAPKTSVVVQKPLPTDPEERFKFLFTEAILSGRWAPLKDGVLGEERGGDK